MKRLSFVLSLSLICVKIFSQDIVDNLDMFLSTRYIESNDNIYLYLEIHVNNRNPDTVFISIRYMPAHRVTEQAFFALTPP